MEGLATEMAIQSKIIQSNESVEFQNHEEVSKRSGHCARTGSGRKTTWLGQRRRPKDSKHHASKQIEVNAANTEVHPAIQGAITEDLWQQFCVCLSNRDQENTSRRRQEGNGEDPGVPLGHGASKKAAARVWSHVFFLFSSFLTGFKAFIL